MKRYGFLILLAAIALLSACAEEKPKPLSEPGEKLYTVRGVILGRDASRSTVNLDHEAIPGFMAPMVMDYEVRGVKVDQLPADKTRIEAKLHVTKRNYWITDIKQIP